MQGRNAFFALVHRFQECLRLFRGCVFFHLCPLFQQGIKPGLVKFGVVAFCLVPRVAGQGGNGLADAVQSGLFFTALLKGRFNGLVDPFVPAFGLFLYCLETGFVGQSAGCGLSDIRCDTFHREFGQETLRRRALKGCKLFFSLAGPGILLFDRLGLYSFSLLRRCLGCLAGSEQFLDERSHKSILGC